MFIHPTVHHMCPCRSCADVRISCALLSSETLLCKPVSRLFSGGEKNMFHNTANGKKTRKNEKCFFSHRWTELLVTFLNVLWFVSLSDWLSFIRGILPCCAKQEDRCCYHINLNSLGSIISPYIGRWLFLVCCTGQTNTEIFFGIVRNLSNKTLHLEKYAYSRVNWWIWACWHAKAVVLWPHIPD